MNDAASKTAEEGQSSEVSTAELECLEFRRCGRMMVDFVADYHENMEARYRVFPQVQPGYLRELLPSEAPRQPETWETVMRDVEAVIMPGITHWQHPHFHAYFPCAMSYPALCGDILSGGIGCIGFTWASSPACTELEVVIMDWLAKVMGLPWHFLSDSGCGGGVIYNSTSEATLVCLFAARNKAIEEYLVLHPGADRYTVMGRLVGYYSEEAHCSVEKAGLLSMIRLRPVPTIQRRLRASSLLNMIQDDLAQDRIPFFCVATLGTTGSCVFDALDEVGPLCIEHGVWLHVDAAYAGSAFVCPENRKFMIGVEHAMSYVFNPHKWLLVNFDCTALWFKETKYVVDPFSVNPSYLKHKHQSSGLDFRNWQIPLGRRFRSLKIWFTLRLYGIDRLQEYIRNHIRLAKSFEQLLTKDPRFEIVEDVTMALVCFRLKETGNELNRKLYNLIETDGRIHIIISTFHNHENDLEATIYLRFAVCYQFANKNHIEYAHHIIIELANQISGSKEAAIHILDTNNITNQIPVAKKLDIHIINQPIKPIRGEVIQNSNNENQKTVLLANMDDTFDEVNQVLSRINEEVAAKKSYFQKNDMKTKLEFFNKIHSKCEIDDSEIITENMY